MTNRRVFVPVLLAAAVLAVPAAALAAAGPAPGSAARAAQPAAARPANGLGQKPYMGWSSWSLESTRFPGYNGESFITEANVKKMSNVMASKLQAFGYTYVNIDSGWSNGFDSFGRPRADSGRHSPTTATPRRAMISGSQSGKCGSTISICRGT